MRPLVTSSLLGWWSRIVVGQQTSYRRGGCRIRPHTPYVTRSLRLYGTSFSNAWWLDSYGTIDSSNEKSGGHHIEIIRGAEGGILSGHLAIILIIWSIWTHRNGVVFDRVQPYLRGHGD
jgi:hypothetical protein